ncbi:MAG: electron transport complex subunit E [Candidatus Firestonebacteria bacterium]|nr:electron transport complex subunit E [Candidatus Firestonebacteria bacterium]
MSKKEIILGGMFKDNPIFRLVLGMCSTLAVTVSLENGIMMGLAVIFVLLGSNILVALLRKYIPQKVRIPAFIVIIAGFVTIVELLMHAYTEEIYIRMGIFIPLIVVNCIMLARAEAFAYKNTVMDSIYDAIGIGMGYFMAIFIISFCREIIGANQLFGYPIIKDYEPVSIFLLPPGGFFTLGLLLAFFNWLDIRKRSRQ